MARTRSTALAIACLALAAGGVAWLVTRGSESPTAPVDTRDAPQSDRSEASAVSRLAPEIESERVPAVATVTPLEASRGRGDDPSPTAAENALVRVLVVHAKDRAPVAGADCSLTPPDVSNGETSRMASSSHAARGEWTKTGGDGRCELEVAPNRECQLSVSLLDHERASRMLPALAPREAVDIVMELRSLLDVDFYGMVVDDETGEPIPDASIEGEGERSDVRLSTDAYGRFALRVTSWLEFPASAKAQGYARRLFRLGNDHETEANALVVRMSPAATLLVIVLDASGAAVPRAGISASASWYKVAQDEGTRYTAGGESPVWQTISDASGHGSLTDLPPHVPLGVVATSGTLERKLAEPIELEAREVRYLELRLGGGTRIRGLLVDSAGTAIGGHEIWCLSSDRQHDGPIHRFQEHEVSARVTTDEQGKFELDDMAAGTWWLAPAPQEEQSFANDRDAVLPLAQPVVVEPFAKFVDIVLHAERGSFVQGRVVDPSGGPVARATVHASMRGPLYFSASGKAGTDGSFVVGPLRSGRYEVTARAIQTVQRFADSIPLQVEAGTTDLMLRLREGGAILGSVVDGSTGAKRDADLEYLQTDVERSGSWNTMTLDGSFEFRGLSPGVYAIGAKTRTGQFGYRTELAVSAGQILDDVKLVVAPGGTLRLRFDGPGEMASCQVLAHGLHVARERLARGTSVECAVPAEPIEVLIHGHGAPDETRAVTVSPGASVELVIGKAP